MKKQLLLTSSFVCLSFFAGCSTDDSDVSNGGTGLRATILADGVEGFDYSITPVDCDTGLATGDAIPGSAEIRENQTLPGNLETFLNRPFAGGSEHSFADKFFTVPAGCYDIVATPYGAGAESCSSASLKAVLVKEGETTERLLISQCEGVDLGALDVIASINNDPSLDDVYFPVSKFSCAAPSSICIEMSDSNGDPLRAEVTFAEGVPCSAGAFGKTEFGYCAELVCTAPGSYKPLVTVYDQAYNSDGDLVDIEDLLVDFGGNESLTSRASLEAQIHVDGVVLYADTDGDSFGGERAFLCEPEEGYVGNSDDCNDGDAAINPNGTEVCGNGIDEDCKDGDAVCPPSGCEGQTCGTYTGDCECDGDTDGYCWKSTEDGVQGVCGTNFYCGGKAGCDSNADCGAGENCIVETCCGNNGTGKAGICAPAATFAPVCTDVMGFSGGDTAGGNGIEE